MNNEWKSFAFVAFLLMVLMLLSICASLCSCSSLGNLQQGMNNISNESIYKDSQIYYSDSGKITCWGDDDLSCPVKLGYVDASKH